MIEVEIQIPSAINPDELIKLIESICIDNGLICKLKGTLTMYPGCVHWHFRKNKQAGTLEITWWEKEERLWFKVAQQRKATWIEEAIPIIKRQIEKSLT